MVVAALLTGPLAVVAGCGSDSSSDPNGGGAGAPGDGGLEAEVSVGPPAEPQLPECLQGDNPPGCAAAQLPDCLQGDNPAGCAAPPELVDWTCPTAWIPTEVGEGEPWAYSICVPPDPPECPDGEAAFLGETACHLLGTACPAGDFLDETTLRQQAPGFDGTIWYVKAGAGGTGTTASPFGTIAEAVEAAAPGDIIALAAETVSEGVILGKAVALVGACVGGTAVLAPSLDEEGGTIVINGTGGSLVANLRVSGQRRGVWIQPIDSSVVLHNLEVKSAIRAGIVSYNTTPSASVEMAEVAIRDTEAMPSDLSRGIGISCSAGGGCTIARALVERNRSIGIVVSDAGSSASVTDVVVRHTQSTASDEEDGNGFWVQLGAKVTATRVLLADNRHAGMVAMAPGTSLEFADVVVRDTRSEEASLTQGMGLAVFNGAKVTGVRGLFERNRHGGLICDGADSTIDLTDVVVRDTQGQEKEKTRGDGVVVQSGTSAILSRALIERNRSFGISAVQGTVKMSDIVVRDTLSAESDLWFGLGLEAEQGATVTASRALFAGNRMAAVRAFRTGTTVQLSDVTVLDTRGSDADGSGGEGIALLLGAEGTVTRARLERNRNAAVLVAIGASLDASELLVRDTQSEEATKTMGAGIRAELDATVTIARAVLERNRDAALSAGGKDASLTIQDVVVRDTMSRESDQTRGFALAADLGALARVERALFEDNRDTGVLAMSPGTTIELTDSLVRRTASRETDKTLGIGLNVQDGASARVNRSLFAGNRHTGILVMSAGSSLELGDVEVSDTESREKDLRGGRGLEVNSGAYAKATRVRFNRNRDFSVLVSGAGTVADLFDLGARSTLMRACAESGSASPCVENGLPYGAGSALAATDEARVTVASFELSGSAECGLHIAGNAGVAASGGLVHDNAIGANVQIPGYDMTKIQGPTLLYWANGTDFDSLELPIPEALQAPEEAQSANLSD